MDEGYFVMSVEQLCKICGCLWIGSQLRPCPECGFRNDIDPIPTHDPEPEDDDKETPS